MAWPKKTLQTIRRLRSVRETIKELFVGRELVVELLTLAAVCQEHLLILGPPGTAKSDLVNRFTDLVEGRGFHYLLTQFTEPSELFGPLDIPKFKEGTYHIRTTDMLPEAQIAFLDEVFQGSSAILNNLLTLVHERVFHNGAMRQGVPLLSLVGASNALPDDPILRAFSDRFVLRMQLNPVASDQLNDLVSRGWELEKRRIQAVKQAREGGAAAATAPLITIDELLDLHGLLDEVRTTEIQPVYADVVRELRAEGLELTDRRTVKGMKLIAGAALLRESDQAEPQDLWPLNHFWGRPEDIPALRNVIQPRVDEAGGPIRDHARPESEIREDLDTLAHQEPLLRRESQVVTHLGRYNELRQEVLRDHPENAELRRDLEGRIERLFHHLAGLEGGHV